MATLVCKNKLSLSDQIIDGEFIGIQKNIYNKIRMKYTTLCDLTWSRSSEVNPRYKMSDVESYTVNIQHTTCRICDFMRLVLVFLHRNGRVAVDTIWRRNYGEIIYRIHLSSRQQESWSWLVDLTPPNRSSRLLLTNTVVLLTSSRSWRRRLTNTTIPLTRLSTPRRFPTWRLSSWSHKHQHQPHPEGDQNWEGVVLDQCWLCRHC